MATSRGAYSKLLALKQAKQDATKEVKQAEAKAKEAAAEVKEAAKKSRAKGKEYEKEIAAFVKSLPDRVLTPDEKCQRKLVARMTRAGNISIVRHERNSYNNTNGQSY